MKAHNEGKPLVNPHVDRPIPAEPPPITIKVPGAVRMTGISRSRLYELIRDKEIETVKLGASTLIVVESLHRLIERLRNRV